MTYLLLEKVLYSANEFLTNTSGLLVEPLQTKSKNIFLFQKSRQHSKLWSVIRIVLSSTVQIRTPPCQPWATNCIAVYSNTSLWSGLKTVFLPTDWMCMLPASVRIMGDNVLFWCYNILLLQGLHQRASNQSQISIKNNQKPSPADPSLSTFWG